MVYYKAKNIGAIIVDVLETPIMETGSDKQNKCPFFFFLNQWGGGL